MGNFYVNYTLRGPNQKQVVAALAGRSARVTPVHKNCVVVFDEQSNSQDQQVIAALGAKLSTILSCPCLAVLNHDDDILWYQLHLNGMLVDEYDSTPGYFDPKASPSKSSGGDVTALCSLLGGDPAAVSRVLKSSTFDSGGYVFAVKRHADLVRALDISPYGVGTAYSSFDRDEYPDGLSAGDILEADASAPPVSISEYLEAKKRQDYQNMVELFQGAALNDPARIRRAVKELGVDPNIAAFGGETPLHIACSKSAVDAARTLLKLGADPNRRYACESTSGERQTNRTALMHANSMEIVRLLLEHVADPNAADTDGFTPLMQAAKRSDVEAVELLFVVGADPLARTRIANGETRNAREFAETWIKLLQHKPPSEELITAIEKAQEVVAHLVAAESFAASGRQKIQLTLRNPPERGHEKT